jgi:hypothetical protein
VSDTPDPGVLSGRHLRRRIRESLASGKDLETILAELAALAPRQAVNPLFSCFYDRSARVKWRSVYIMGKTVARLAETNMESARVVMRRLMWNLNDESGGIGWGSPEAMAEIMANHRRLADEYASMLVSYVRPEANYLEHEGLQRGAIWGIGRLAQVRPELAAGAVEALRDALFSADPYHRGYAAWGLGILKDREAMPGLDRLSGDAAEIEIFRETRLITTTVGRLAQEAAAAITNGGS